MPSSHLNVHPPTASEQQQETLSVEKISDFPEKNIREKHLLWDLMFDMKGWSDAPFVYQIMSLK